MNVLENGLLFFWISWILWVIVTFFMQKNLQRLLFAIYILLLIITSQIYISINEFTLSVSLLLTIVACLIALSKLKRPLYYTFISFTVMIGYMAILIWEKTTPVWMFLPRNLLIPMILLILIICLGGRLRERLTYSMFGICSGEMMYHMMFSNYFLSDVIGNLSFLDLLLVTVGYNIMISVFQYINEKVFSYTSKYKEVITFKKEPVNR